jgi:dGTPase
LNLSLETLEGLVKHNGPLSRAHEDERVLRAAVAEAGLDGRVQLALFAPAEAQVAAIADDIAYNCHDLDDGLRAGLIGLDDLTQVPLAGRFLAEAAGASLETGRVIYEVNRRMITAMIDDVVRCSKMRLETLERPSLQSVREAGRPVIVLSEDRSTEMMGLKAFLYAKVYRHPRVMHVMRGAEQIVADLFARYMAEPGEMPPPWRNAGAGEAARAAVVADFVAGMTDRYAINEHRRLFDATPELR